MKWVTELLPPSTTDRGGPVLQVDCITRSPCLSPAGVHYKYAKVDTNLGTYECKCSTSGFL